MTTEVFIYILVATIAIMVASISGIIFLQKTFRNWLDKNLSILVSFSAGVFVFVAFELANESLEILQANSLLTFLSIAIGITIFLLLKELFPESHHHSGDCKHHHHDKSKAMRMMLGDSLHNVVDGFIIASSFIIDIRLGIVASISIFIHELLQEVSEFFVLRDSGYSIRQALVRNFLISTTIIVGVIASFFVTQESQPLGILLGIASGTFLYIVFVDLFTYEKINGKISDTLQHILAFAIGIVFMVLLNIFL